MRGNCGVVGRVEIHAREQHLERAAAGESDLPRFVVIERDRKQLVRRAAAVEQRVGRLDHLRVDAPADRHAADDPAAAADDHLGADLLGGAGRGGYECREGDA